MAPAPLRRASTSKAPHSRRLLWLLALLLVSSTSLAALGLVTMVEDSQRGAARWRDQGEAALRALDQELGTALERWRAGAGSALAFSSGPDFLLRFESLWPLERAATEPCDSLLAEHWLSQSERLEFAGDLAAAAQTLQLAAERFEHSERAQERACSAALWTRLAALELARGKQPEARALWQRLIDEQPGARDARGLLRSLAARSRMLELDGWPAEATLSLYLDLSADQRERSESASASLRQAVLAALEAQSLDARLTEELAQARALEASRAQAREFARAWRAGASNWLAQQDSSTRLEGATCERLLQLGESGSWLVCARYQEQSWRGGALSLTQAAQELLRAPALMAFAEVGLAPMLEAADGSLLARTELHTDAAAERPELLARAPLGAPLGECRASVLGWDASAFWGRERQRLWWFGALSLLALACAGFAAAASWRALRRELLLTRQREDFVAAVTHELRSPVASIRLLSEIAAEGEISPERAREFARYSLVESERLGALIEAVLERARLERGGQDAPREWCAAGELCQGVLARAAPRAQAAGCSLHLELPPDAQHLGLLAERRALERALDNGLDNALKYGASPIRMSLVRIGHWLRFCIEDAGPGVASADRERAFEAFVRLGDESTREQPGVGLGLALVRGTAEAHGGRAWLEAGAAGGARFCLELPQAPRPSSVEQA